MIWSGDETAEVAKRVPRILLVDDSCSVRGPTAYFLRRNGYEVCESGDGRSAIEKLKNRQIDAVLLDLLMPCVNGFQVLSYLQEHRKSLPVILLSGMPLDHIQHKMHGLRTHELPPLLLKPVDLDQLLQLLELQLAGALKNLETSPDPPNSRQANQ